MKIEFIFGAVVAALFSAGCGASSEKIYFVSEVKVPPAMVSAEVRAKGLDKADEAKIQLVVLSYLMERQSAAVSDYSALFLQADDAVVAAMIKKFPSHIPPIKPSSHIDLRANQSPLDKDSGKPSMILGADVSEPGTDGLVAVVGRWYAGSAEQGTNTFTMKKTGDDWLIDSVK